METDLTFEEHYADMVAASTRTLPEQYFTVGEYSRDTGLPERTAYKRLAEKVEAGALEARMVVVDGHLTRAFWFPV